ncbi:MAG: RNA 2',3'-cyclic phosphodiesterase [Bdellovibrionota bacterium]
MKQHRMFFGFSIEPSFLNVFESSLMEVKHLLSDHSFRWIKETNYHITVKFLGHLPGEKKAELLQSELSWSFHPLTFVPKAWGFFGQRNLRALALEFEEEKSRCKEVVEEVDEFCMNILGLEKRQQVFRPHMTFGRKLGEMDESTTRHMNQILDHISLPKLHLHLSHIHLYESFREDDQLRYAIEKSFCLKN